MKSTLVVFGFTKSKTLKASGKPISVLLGKSGVNYRILMNQKITDYPNGLVQGEIGRPLGEQLLRLPLQLPCF